jgi:hypothetical protein
LAQEDREACDAEAAEKISVNIVGGTKAFDMGALTHSSEHSVIQIERSIGSADHDNPLLLILASSTETIHFLEG